MHSLANHSAAPGNENQDDGMHLQQAGAEGAQWQVLSDPALADPESDESDDAQGCRGWEAFKVFCFARGIVGDTAGGDVEAGETEETAEGEGSQEELVEGGAEADCKGGGGGGDAE